MDTSSAKRGSALDLRMTFLLIVMMVSTAAFAACGGSSDAGEVVDPTATIRPTATSSGQASNPTIVPNTPTTEPNSGDLTGNIAPDFTLPSATGSPVTLSELSAEKPVVVVFYRAFW